MITNKFLPKAYNENAKVFYYKMIGDFYRYIAEQLEGDRQTEATENALENYDKADEVADDIKYNNLNQLNLALNYSLFYYNLKDDSNKASAIAQKALEKPCNENDNMDNEVIEQVKDVTNLLQNNFKFWNDEEGAEEILKGEEDSLTEDVIEWEKLSL